MPAAPRIALATAAEVWRDDTDAEATASALARAGADAEPVVWDDPAADWSGYDLVVVRSTWDYARRREEFLAWADRVAAITRLANPAPLLRWNTDKRYLGDLAAAGVPVVPTRFVAPDERAGLAAALASVATDGELVVKPTVSAGAKDTYRVDAADRAEAVARAGALLAAGRHVMVQPYLAAVDRDGETGLVSFDGVHSHAFRKGALLARGAGPVSGLYAEEEVSPRTAAPDELALAESVLGLVADRVGAPPLYARVDVLRDDDGEPVLLELELTEPSFFLDTDPAAADRMAAAFIAAARA